MSRPRFFADHDVNEQIVTGVLRREPALEFVRARDVGMSERPDAEMLTHAADNGFIVVSHDVNTMPSVASGRMSSGQKVSGLSMVKQSDPVREIISCLIAIWAASEDADWENPVCFLPLH